jgi:hypothetical protein
MNRAILAVLVAIAAGCATPKRGQFCRDWCEPLDLLAVYSDGTCVCSVGTKRAAAMPLSIPDPDYDWTGITQPLGRQRVRR